MQNPLVLVFIAVFVGITIVVTWYTSKSSRSAADFYVAGNSVPWVQTGIAMVGSYLSAASFLGVAGDISIFGVDRIWLAIGFFGGYMAVLMLIAGPLRNVGSYTVADALYRRFPVKEVKLLVMISTLIISMFYLVPQMLGAGLLFELLIGWDFLAVIIGLGVLISVYIIFGGMKATLYNQVIQASFLFGVMVFITVLGMFLFVDGSMVKLVDLVSRIVPPSIAGTNEAVAAAVAAAPNAAEAVQVARQMLPEAPNAMTIGVQTPSLLAQISTVVALVFGTAGLPHILIMFYTVPSAKAAKKSVMLCVVMLGIFYICTIGGICKKHVGVGGYGNHWWEHPNGCFRSRSSGSGIEYFCRVDDCKCIHSKPRPLQGIYQRTCYGKARTGHCKSHHGGDVDSSCIPCGGIEK